jgi:uronate dehydrogenase
MTQEPLIVLTGAAGKIGRRTRAFLKGRCRLRSTDMLELGEAGRGEEVALADLSRADDAARVVRDATAVVHLAGIPRDAPIDAIAGANMIATWNLFEAARDAGVRRVVLGSTNHVVGFYAPEERLDAETPPRADSLYGASKVFAESVARLFWDKHGLETVCLRIGSALERPTELRHLSTWVSYDDLNRLIWASLTAERTGFTVAYGISDNARAWWSNAGARHLGYQPEDRSADHEARLIAANRLSGLTERTLDAQFQGGRWAAEGYDRTRIERS